MLSRQQRRGPAAPQTAQRPEANIFIRSLLLFNLVAGTCACQQTFVETLGAGKVPACPPTLQWLSRPLHKGRDTGQRGRLAHPACRLASSTHARGFVQNFSRRAV